MMGWIAELYETETHPVADAVAVEPQTLAWRGR